MPATDSERAHTFLQSFVDQTLFSIECDEFQLRLKFKDGPEFVTRSPWRVIRGDSLIFGNGDVGKQSSDMGFEQMIGLKVISASLSCYGDADLVFERDHLIQVISNSGKFETWEAHLKAGWIIFTSGETTVFPPAPAVPASTQAC